MLEVLANPRVGWALALVITTLIVRLLQKLHFYRSLVKGLPGPPHSYLWGSLRSMGEVIASQPKRAAPQTYGLLIKEHYGLGDYFYVDPWPFGDPILMIFDADLMNQLTVKQSLPKHPEVEKFMRAVGGPGNMVSSEGAEWKKWRSAFNPGFAANHLMSLVPLIVDDVLVFNEIMTKHAKNDDLFRMERAATSLTVDIIGKVVLDFDLASQKGPNELVDTFMKQVQWQRIGAQFAPIELIDGPIRIPMQWYLTWKMDRYISKRLDERFSSRERRGKSRATIDLALEAYLKEVKGPTGDISEVKTIDPEFKRAAINNIKTFIFAGHDTTSSTIAYAFYYLSKNPEMLEKIRKEHNDVFGPDRESVPDQLKQDPRLLNKLEYTLAVMREVLRLQPPASTVRLGQKGFFLRDPATGEQLPTEHMMLWPIGAGLHRTEKYWTEPHVFKPERHLTHSSDGSANYNSREAWVAFSRGNRNCIGQELAMIETKVILAMTIRTFDFQPAFHELDKLKGDGSGYPSDMSGVQEQFGDEAYQIQLGTAKPREGMPCRIRLRA